MPLTKAELEKRVDELEQQLAEAQETQKEQQLAASAQLEEEYDKVATAELRAEKVLEENKSLRRTIESLQKDSELSVSRAKDAVRKELQDAHQRELATRDELNFMLRDKAEVARNQMSDLEARLDDKCARIAELEDALRNSEARIRDAIPSASRTAGLLGLGAEEGDGDTAGMEQSTDSPPLRGAHGREGYGRQKLSPSLLPNFSGEEVEADEGAFDRWVRKLQRFAEIDHWSEREQLLQFELHLTGKAEATYDVLPSEAKEAFQTAVAALRARLQPVKREALRSAELIKRRQQPTESVDHYAHDFERLFMKSYGVREGMDSESREMLKRDLYVQGLLLKWQKKVLPSADTFNDALHQARAAEEQEKQLAMLHCPDTSGKGTLPEKKKFAPTQTNPPPRGSRSAESYNRQSFPGHSGGPTSFGDGQQRRGGFRGKCYKCNTIGHRAQDCYQSIPTEANGRKRITATTSTVTMGRTAEQTETLEERCQRLQKELAAVELQRMSSAYETSLEVNVITGAIGPLFYADVQVVGVPVRALIDTGSSATILSFDVFKKIGKLANIPSTSLHAADIILRDYNRRPIPIGARVDLQICWNGKSTTVPVYLRSDDGNVSSDPCLLGTNAIIPLGLMTPGVGVEATPAAMAEKGVSSATVSLVQAVRVPGRCTAMLTAQLEGEWRGDSMIFHPDEEFAARSGLQLDDSILQPDATGRVYLPVVNPTADFWKLTPHTLLGKVERVDLDAPDPDVPGTDDPRTLTISVHATTTLCDANEQRREFLDSQLQISKDGHTEEEVTSLRKCVLDAADVFAVGKERGEVKLVEHRIETGDHPPIKQSSRRVPYAYRGEITKMVNEMLEDKVIRESSSPWASPVILVKKKDGSLHFCVDYRRLNAVTRKDVFPLPRIDDILDQLKGKPVFSILDAKTGYWQIGMEESSQERTAFATSNGLYEFRVMPFGLCNAPATFQRLMQRVLSGLGDFCSVYIDDIIVFSSSIEEHLDHLKQVFNRLCRVGLKLHPRKCIFGSGEVLFLGHLVSARGILPDPEKIIAVKRFPVPSCIKALRQFLGLASYYRRFIPNFAKIASPLHALLRQDVPFLWTPLCQQAFDKLKDLLTSPPVLAYPDFSAKFVLHTDASREGLGAVLEQEKGGQNHPIAYASRSLSQHEKNYAVTELEALAVVWAVKHFRAYLVGQKCELFTDHAPLKSMLTTKHPSGKLARWSQTLAEVDLSIHYRPGRKHSNADALSRAPVPIDGQTATITAITESPIQENETDSSLPEMAMMQRDDADLRQIFNYLEKEELPEDEKRARRLVLESSHFSILDGVLYYVDSTRKNKPRIAAPMAVREQLLRENHSGRFAGHFSAKGLYEKLVQRFWWSGMYTDVHTHCRSCLTCASHGGAGRRSRPPLKPLEVGDPFARVGVNILEMPRTEEGNCYVITFVDYLTKWVEAFPTSDQSSETIARLLVNNVICKHGVPKQLLSDQGPNLLSNLMLDVCNLMGIKKTNTTAYHPQTDGLVENFNRTLIAMIAKHAKTFGRNWDVYLPQLLFAYRTKPHESTGESPFFLLYGRDARLPTETAFTQPMSPYLVDVDDYRAELMTGFTESWRQARQNIFKAQAKQKKYYDRNPRSKKVHFQVGGRALVYMPREVQGKNRKLSLPYHGPFRILEVQTNCLLLRPVDKPDDSPR